MSAELTHSPAEILATLYRAYDSTWPVLVSMEPPDKNDVVTFFDSNTGTTDGRSMIDGETWDHWGIQVRVRSVTHRSGWNKMASIRNWASKHVNQNLVAIPADNTLFLVWAITNIGQILEIGRQTPMTKRSIFTLNFRTPIREILSIFQMTGGHRTVASNTPKEQPGLRAPGPKLSGLRQPVVSLKKV